MSIYQLINEIEQGLLVLPAIQRDFVWEEEKIEMLFDSIMRGYPIGIVLLWDTYTKIQYRGFEANYGALRVHRTNENNNENHLRVVLDGQQRLTSLFIGLKGSYDSRILCFDLLSGRHQDDQSERKFDFRFLKVGRKNDPNRPGQSEANEPPRWWCPLSEIIGKDNKALRTLRHTVKSALSLADEDEARLEDNLNLLPFALTQNTEIIKTQTIDHNLPSGDYKRKSMFDILEIFVRINRQGIQLTRSDLITSMLRLYWPGAAERIPTFKSDIVRSTTIDLSDDFIIRCLFVCAGLGTRLDLDLLRIPANVSKLIDNFDPCCVSIREALDFCRQSCQIDSVRLLSGPGALVPFVYWISRLPKQQLPSSSETSARTALYLFAFSKVFTQHIESRTGAFIKAHIKDGQQKFPLEAAVRFVSEKTWTQAPDKELFSNNSVLALSLVQRYDGKAALNRSNTLEMDHIFPRAVLIQRGIPESVADDLGNFWLLPAGRNRNKSAKSPSVYMKDVPDPVLKSAFIERAALQYSNVRPFVRSRSKCIVQWLQEHTGLNNDLFSLSETE